MFSPLFFLVLLDPCRFACASRAAFPVSQVPHFPSFSSLLFLGIFFPSFLVLALSWVSLGCVAPYFRARFSLGGRLRRFPTYPATCDFELPKCARVSPRRMGSIHCQRSPSGAPLIGGFGYVVFLLFSRRSPLMRASISPLPAYFRQLFS